MIESPRFGYVQYTAVIVVAVAIVAVSAFLTQKNTLSSDVALTDATVVATLQTSGTGYPPDLQGILHAARAAPTDLPAAKTAARALIAQGRVAGDSRMVGAASGVLQPFMATADAETLYLVATARQYQHDFTGALALLDQAITLQPTDANALLSRATINTVLGKFDLASTDCQRISSLPRPELGFLCQSTALLLTAQAPQVYQRLKTITADPGLLDPALRGWAVGLMGEIASLQGDVAAAKAHYAEVIAADPLALRERLLLVDLLLAEKAATDALAQLVPAPDVDGVLIRRVLAAQMLGDTAMAAQATSELDRRFRLNLDLGLTAHAREEARYYLEIAGDPVLALKRAIVNWDLQHEIEDAQLLIDAAVAANNPKAALPVLAWIKGQSVAVPTLRIPDAVRQAAE